MSLPSERIHEQHRVFQIIQRLSTVPHRTQHRLQSRVSLEPDSVLLLRSVDVESTVDFDEFLLTPIARTSGEAEQE